MLRLFILACFVCVCYSTICGPSDSQSFETCMNQTLPPRGPDDFNACFTNNNCSAPAPKNESAENGHEEQHGGRSFGRGRGKGRQQGHEEGFFPISGKVNATLALQCAEQLKQSVKDDVKSCVQTTYGSNFDFPSFKGKGRKGHPMGKGEGHERGGYGGGKTQCANEKAVKTCLEGLFNHSAICAAMEQCKTQATCNKTETEAAVCSCANSTIEANAQKYEDAYFTCIGQTKPTNTRMQQKMKEKAKQEFCHHGDEKDMCNGGGHNGGWENGKEGEGNKGRGRGGGQFSRNQGGNHNEGGNHNQGGKHNEGGKQRH